jgi:dienelactone hydrolase
MTTTALRAAAMGAILVLLAACTTYVPLSADYRRPEALPPSLDVVAPRVTEQSLAVMGGDELRERARFTVRQVTVPSTDDAADSIVFEYYDVEGDEPTPAIVLLPIFNGEPWIPRFFARYFANQGWAAAVVLRGRDPLTALVEPEETMQGNLNDYLRVLDWAEQRPDIDATRIGVFGVSLGAMDGVVLAALDERVKALVVAMAGGDLPYLMLNTHYRPVVRRLDALAESEGTSREALSAALDARLRTDPLTLARYVDAQRVLMIITRTDAIIPFDAQQRLRASLGTPETLYLATGHRPSVVFFPKVRAASFEFFTRQFAAVQVGLARN